MPDIDKLMDLYINPALNNTLTQPAKSLSSEELEQAGGFTKIFDDINDMVMDLPDESIEKPKDKSDEKKTYQSYSQQFGPPLGLEIENFSYSII